MEVFKLEHQIIQTSIMSVLKAMVLGIPQGNPPFHLWVQPDSIDVKVPRPLSWGLDGHISLAPVTGGVSIHHEKLGCQKKSLTFWMWENMLRSNYTN